MLLELDLMLCNRVPGWVKDQEARTRRAIVNSPNKGLPSSL